jgi:4-phospho-D-threonate 3-dehydrogenase / 4-phospho-D-erythronate 3-dehydrogenase
LSTDINPAKLSRIILTTGDPNGIGPEIILKIFEKNNHRNYDLFIAGNKKVFDYYSKLLGIKNIPVKKFIDVPLSPKYKIQPGKIDKLAGKFAGDCINKGIQLCLSKEFDSVVTLPVNKESLNKGGYKFPGHTEMLTKLAGSGNTAMMLISKKLSISPLTTHIPLKEVSKNLNQEKIIGKIITVNNSLVKDFKIKNPKLAMLALNPHAGDGGEIGNEEIKVLIPVIDKMRSTGFNISGPFPADSFFATKSYKRFDLTFSAYHDQGLIPFKMLEFERGVNYTAGLKIIRTSPDHGTAFDIAGLGRADIRSTLEAIKIADKLSRHDRI